MNAQSQQSLFRSEVIEARRARIEGEIVLAQPVRTTALVLLLFFFIALAAAWIASGRYARTESGRGILVTDQASAKIVAIRPGVVTQLLVREGQAVKAGDKLALVQVEQPAETGASSIEEGLDALDSQRLLAERQLGLVDERGATQRARLAAVRAGLVQQRENLERQMELQQEVVASTKKTFDRLASLVERGFVSRIEMERRRQTWLAARQELARLEQQVDQAMAEDRRAATEAAQIAVDGRSEAISARSSIKTMVQQQARLRGERAYMILAPIEGRVAALQTAAGRTVDAAVPLMEIIPERSSLRAQVYAPSRAIGFVKPGQEVRLLYDAFPYQRFGSFGGRIGDVSRVVIDPRELGAPLKIEEPVYRIEVIPDAQTVEAFGDRQPLQPGMTLTANIILERRTFLDWLLSPLRAVLRRDG